MEKFVEDENIFLMRKKTQMDEFHQDLSKILYDAVQFKNLPETVKRLIILQEKFEKILLENEKRYYDVRKKEK